MSDAQAVTDALRYPFAPDALVTNLALTLSQIIVSFVPVIGLLLSLVVWATTYRYALEILTASGQGRREPPQGSMLTDVRSQRGHLWIQVLAVVGLVVVAHTLGPVAAACLLIGIALALPGALLAYAAAQNLLAAFNPGAWIAVFRIVGPAYLLLSVSIGLTLLLQLAGYRIFGQLRPAILGDALYYLCVHAALFASFRLIGTRLYAHASALGVEDPIIERPQLARDRERSAVLRETREAEALEDPTTKAAALALILRRGGASDELHAEYRRCLRAADNRDALEQHARVRVCELLALAQPKSAVPLGTEALADSPLFYLPDADSTTSFCNAAEASGQLRLATALASNYRQQFPKRFDGLPLVARASALLSDKLGDADAAERLLTDALLLSANGSESEEFERLLKRLRAGILLADVSPRLSSPHPRQPVRR